MWCGICSPYHPVSTLSWGRWRGWTLDNKQAKFFPSFPTIYFTFTSSGRRINKYLSEMYILQIKRRWNYLYFAISFTTYYISFIIFEGKCKSTYQYLFLSLDLILGLLHPFSTLEEHHWHSCPCSCFSSTPRVSFNSSVCQSVYF